ncbi:MAG: CCA tRNA nucleotidyltransferase [Deltaproteobacteria bacterium]|nr:CCA tRNA nucleotidyltransferase [Deltaproteobacteria bacterium]
MLAFLQAIQEAGGDIFEVGGSLRDRLLNLPLKDQDLLVAKLPLQRLTKILSRFGKVQQVGKSFGVLKFVCQENKSHYDIALPRTERSTGLGHRDFEVNYDPFLPIEKDLARRDFTINAMARNLITEEWLDPFQGRCDLEKKILRQVFEKTFEEDPLRMLRGVQFAARFDLHFDAETFHAIQQHATLLSNLSTERILEELNKAFLAKKPSIAFEYLKKLQLLKHIFPHLTTQTEESEKSDREWKIFLNWIDLLRKHPSIEHQGEIPLLFLGTFYSFDASARKGLVQEAKTWLTRYHSTMLGIEPAFVEKQLLWQNEFQGPELTDIDIRRMLHLMTPLGLSYWLDLKLASALLHSKNPEKWVYLRDHAQKILAERPPLTLKDLALKGEDLLKLGFAKGPKIGKILKRLMDIVLEDPHQNEYHLLLNHIPKDEDGG